MQTCPDCGKESPDRFGLCGYCGSVLAVLAPSREARKTVTVVLCNLKGSAELAGRLDSEALREVLTLYFSAMKSVLERHGGTIEKYSGDVIMAIFGLPRLHEDDALRAVRAATQMRVALAELNATLRARHGVILQNRTGIGTGEVVTGEGGPHRLATGSAVNAAGRLEQAAPPGGILIGETTYRLVRDAVEVVPAVPLDLEGKPEAVPAYRLVSVTADTRSARPAGLPLVGRARELAALGAEFRRASRGTRTGRTSCSGACGRPWRNWPAVGRSWWSSTISTGRSRPSSISSRASSTPRSGSRSCLSARPATNSARTGHASPRGSRRRPRSSSGSSPMRSAAW